MLTKTLKDSLTHMQPYIKDDDVKNIKMLAKMLVYLWTTCDFLCHQHHFWDFQSSLFCQRLGVFWSDPWRRSQDSWANQFYLEMWIRKGVKNNIRSRWKILVFITSKDFLVDTKRVVSIEGGIASKHLINQNAWNEFNTGHNDLEKLILPNAHQSTEELWPY